MKTKKSMLAIFGVALAVMSAVLTGCGRGDDRNSARVADATRSISQSRCDANKAAGKITYLTGYDYSASASTVDVVMAEKNQFFKKFCLDVQLQSGFTTANIPLVSEGKAQFTGLGALSEVADANVKGAKLLAVGMYGHKSIEALAVRGDTSIKSLIDIKGTSMGVVGSIPFSVRVMLVRAGVPLDSFTQLHVSYDPTQLATGRFLSRPVYKSNEPYQLDKANIAYRLFDPAIEGAIPASFGVMTTNADFAKKHPTAVEDFLRADLMGFKYAVDDPEGAVRTTFEKSDPKYYLTAEGEMFRWKTEVQLIKESTPSDKSFGYIDIAQANAELATLVDTLKVGSSVETLSKSYDPQFFENIHTNNVLNWPKS